MSAPYPDEDDSFLPARDPSLPDLPRPRRRGLFLVGAAVVLGVAGVLVMAAVEKVRDASDRAT
jgi:hypothetical protein